MKSLWERVKEGVLVADGAMGTMLQQKGLSAREVPEEWNLTHPEEVTSIHRAYLAVGSEVILTNTFGSNRLKLRKAGRQDQAYEYTLAGAGLAREAAGERAFVLGDVGPTGEFVEPLGTTSYEELYQVFAGQVKALQEGKVDGIIIETMTDLEETKAAVSAARDNSDLPVLATMAFNPGNRGFRTMMGVGIPEMVKELVGLGCQLIGANCGGVGVEEMVELIRQMSEELGKHNRQETFLIAEPNAGVAQLRGGKTVFPETPESMAEKTVALKEAGARIIGGCCGTTPEHIRAMVRKLKEC